MWRVQYGVRYNTSQGCCYGDTAISLEEVSNTREEAAVVGGNVSEVGRLIELNITIMVQFTNVIHNPVLGIYLGNTSLSQLPTPAHG